ncbi:MAG: penicillin-binding protein 2 [Opitutaceae bacterium]|nr:penicillin-binding protein 2 [Opitutaceae bacterium]
MKRSFASSYRLVLVCVLVMAAFSGIGVRLVYLQVIDRDRYVAEVERTRKRVQVMSARRGEIRDANGNVFATNRSFIEVGVDPQAIKPEDEARAPQLARLLGVSQADVLEAFRRKTQVAPETQEMRQIRWTKLAPAVEEPIYEQVLGLGIKGVYGNRQFRRVYPDGTRAAHVVGYVNREGTAVMGVESFLDFYLRGQDGWVESERDGLRRELAQFRAREIEPVDGHNAILSIDSVVQTYIEQEMRELVRRFNPLGASIIVSDPRDGFILGLANYPTFDLNEFNKADIASQRNISVTDIFEPGSTFKIVPGAAALNEGLVTASSRFDCSEDTMQFRGRTVRLPRDSHDHGIMTVQEIIELSSNRGAARLGGLLGEDRLYKYARAFGFGETSGFALGGEVSGMLAPVKNWDGLTISRMPMGHAIGATPLQVHMAMASIANGGVLMRPQVVRRIEDKDGVIVHEFSPVQRRRVVRPETAELMQRLLVGVVSPKGTAPRAVIPGYEVAGKTGTTQKIIDGRYSSSHHVGSFVGFFPASRPRLVISVIIDDARLNGTAYGATVAGPSFKVIAEQLIQYYGISPTQPLPGNGAAVAQNGANRPSGRDRIR